MSDLISRQAAIDAFIASTSDGDKADWCKWVLKQLPSAQQEIIRCKDCMFKQGNECTRFSDLPINDEDFCSRAQREGDELDGEL